MPLPQSLDQAQSYSARLEGKCYRGGAALAALPCDGPPWNHSHRPAATSTKTMAATVIRDSSAPTTIHPIIQPDMGPDMGPDIICAI